MSELTPEGLAQPWIETVVGSSSRSTDRRLRGAQAHVLGIGADPAIRSDTEADGSNRLPPQPYVDDPRNAAGQSSVEGDVFRKVAEMATPGELAGSRIVGEHF